MSFKSYSGQIDLGDATSKANQLATIIRLVQAEGVSATLAEVVGVSGGSVNVHPLVSQIDGAGNAVDHGIIYGLPVAQYRGGSAAFEIEPTVGDIGLVVFCHNDISAVKRTKKASPPASHRRNAWSDGIYVMSVLGDEPDQYIRIDKSGVSIKAKKVNIDSPEVSVTGKVTTGSGSTFNGIGFDTHTHGGVMAGGSTTGVPE